MFLRLLSNIVEKCLPVGKQMESVIKGIEKAGIMEIVKSAHDTYTWCENPFDNTSR